MLLAHNKKRLICLQSSVFFSKRAPRLAFLIFLEIMKLVERNAILDICIGKEKKNSKMSDPSLNFATCYALLCSWVALILYYSDYRSDPGWFAILGEGCNITCHSCLKILDTNSTSWSPRFSLFSIVRSWIFSLLSAIVFWIKKILKITI